MERRWYISLAALCLVCVLAADTALLRSRETAEQAFTPESADQILVIDAGHGGEDGGAVSVTGTLESQINLAIALKLQQYAGLFGVHVIMLRSEDISIHDSDAVTLREKKTSDLHNRVDIINGLENPVLISIHQNHFDVARYFGAQVFYHADEESKLWAEQTQELLRTLDSTNTRQAAQASSTIYLMNSVSCPALLVECGFLSNQKEAALLETEEYQNKLAAVLLASYLAFEQV